jgi:hypothetical protein
MNGDSAIGTVRDSLATARDSLTDAQMSTPLDTIVRHGRARRRRRRLTGLAGTGAVAVTAALAISLTAVTGSGHRTAIIRTEAFTLVSNANGTVALTINPRVLIDPGTLQSDLKQDGIPALVTVGSFCSSDPPPAGFHQVMSSQFPSDRADTVTFDPSAMPAGTELSFGNFQLASRQETSLALINATSYTCTSTAPTAPPDDGDDGALLIILNRPT